MATTAQNFFPSTTDQDFTASGEVDIRKLVESVGGSDNTTVAAFGTAAATIVLDPYTTNSTTGASGFVNVGWAINRAGADGMGSTATAKRVIPAGTWQFSGRLGAAVLLTSTYRIDVRVYRVSSSGARTLLFGPVASGTLTPSIIGVDWSASSSQPLILLEANETILVSYACVKTNTSLVAESVEFRLNDGSGNDTTIAVPSPGVRTRYYHFYSAIVALQATVKKRIAQHFSVDARVMPTMSRLLTIHRRFDAVAQGVPTMTRRLTLRRQLSATAGVVPTVSKGVGLPRSATAAVVPTVNKEVRLPRSATAAVVPTVSKGVRKEFSATAGVVPTMGRRLTIRRRFEATAAVVPRVFAKLRVDLIPGDGGGSIVRRIIQIFDD